MNPRCVPLLLGLALVGCKQPVDVATFNIRLYPEASTDVDAVAERIAELDASAIAVQEIRDRIAFEAMLASASVRSGRDYRLVLGPCGGNMLEITTAVVYDDEVWDLKAERGYPDLRRDGGCGPSLPGTLAVLEQGSKRLGVLSVHLKAFPQNFETRREEWARVLGIVAEASDEFDTHGFVAMGDYNTTGFDGQPPEERKFVTKTVGDAGYGLPTGELACTEYWRPGETKGPYVPSVLDHIVTHGGTWDAAKVTGMCKRMACEAAQPEALDEDFHKVSDHCPVTLHGKI